MSPHARGRPVYRLDTFPPTPAPTRVNVAPHTHAYAAPHFAAPTPTNMAPRAHAHPVFPPTPKSTHAPTAPHTHTAPHFAAQTPTNGATHARSHPVYKLPPQQFSNHAQPQVNTASSLPPMQLCMPDMPTPGSLRLSMPPAPTPDVLTLSPLRYSVPLTPDGAYYVRMPSTTPSRAPGPSHQRSGHLMTSRDDTNMSFGPP
ncbi:hypothetical protein BV22DRAFT_1135790 [Leucogyrophana mollusca]|uniref:Uncharacterized protein n=1 Tax=Leucogyrophana mollusca TaxID=85980 RepID=A0ACB8AV08_9AGAM|nr:hypothetical protein BV22DRAFT_1135790 [Leucogyrophana mollusca]